MGSLSLSWPCVSRRVWQYGQLIATLLVNYRKPCIPGGRSSWFLEYWGQDSNKNWVGIARPCLTFCSPGFNKMRVFSRESMQWELGAYGWTANGADCGCSGDICTTSAPAMIRDKFYYSCFLPIEADSSEFVLTNFAHLYRDSIQEKPFNNCWY